MISVIVVYNDRALFDEMLGASVARQQPRPELIALDNTGGRYGSAAAALNAGAREARGDYLCFAHQDVRFESDDWLVRAEALLRELPEAGIAGVAGSRARPGGDGREIVSLIEDSVPPQRSDHVALTVPERVDTVDECAFFVPRAVWARHAFDERACDGWHLYAVDFSLSVRAAGLLVYALPLPLYHRSAGAVVRVLGFTTYEGAYFRTLRKVLRKHGARFPRVHTSCGTWRADRSLLYGVRSLLLACGTVASAPPHAKSKDLTP
jgi:GT2 family glycosyltransferase